MKPLAIVAVVCCLVVAGCGRSQPQAPAPAPPPGAAAPATGAATGAAPAVSAVAELPEYPAAVRTQFSSSSERGETKVEAEYTTTDAFQPVVAFYQKAIADAGWSVTSSEKKLDKAEWHLAKASATAEVKVEQERGVVKIKLERKGRT